MSKPMDLGKGLVQNLQKEFESLVRAATSTSRSAILTGTLSPTRDSRKLQIFIHLPSSACRLMYHLTELLGTLRIEAQSTSEHNTQNLAMITLC
mmetsp:Transcript_102995/g.160658  ORF Transcript_102995/g.160658 Transcript_102995/m.160658 type:complete len:94 (-) Transcript_102995:29-310(-)